MSIFKGNLNSANLFTANDDIRGVFIRSVDSIPSFVAYEAGDGTDNYTWWDDSDNFRRHTSAPTAATRNTAGSVISGASNAGADLNLSNVTAVAFPVDLVSDTDSTDDLGSSSKYWAEGYIDKVFFNSTATMEGTTSAGVVTLVGNIIGGASGTGSSFKFFATTAGGYIHWDDTAAGNDGGLIFTDSASLLFGDASDFIIEWDGTNLTMDCKTDNTGVIAIGGTKDTDVLFNGATASSDMLWDASENALHIYDDVVVAFGDSQDFTMKFNATAMVLDNKTANTGNLVIGSVVATDVEFHGTTAGSDMIWDSSTDSLTLADSTVLRFGDAQDFTMNFDGSGMDLDNKTANTGNLVIGSNVATDVEFHGTSAGLDAVWNSSDDALVFLDSTELCFGAALDIYMRYEGTGNTLDIGQTTDGTGSIDFIDITATFTGADSAGTLLTLASLDATGNSDTFVITHTGTGSAIKITGADTDHTALVELVGAAAQTTPYLWLDGDTAGWNGADDVGMLTIANDTALIHNGATMLMIDSTGQAKAGAEGHLARFINTGTARAGAVMVEINAKDTTETALSVPNGMSLFSDGVVTAFDGAQDLTATPAAAEFDTSFGATAKGLAGFVGVAEDSGDGKNYLVVSDGTTWHYVALTAAS
jgi:hypothetical protein